MKLCINALIKQIFPHLYNWVTYGICGLLSNIRTVLSKEIAERSPVSPFMIELVSSLERSFNFAHTGNSKVLSRSLMDPLWLSLGITNDGHPALDRTLDEITFATMPFTAARLLAGIWPVHPRTFEPFYASKRAQTLTYGDYHWKVGG
jgi:hypothetical protein